MQKKLKGQTSKEKILQTSLDEFIKKGVAGAKVNDIVATAKMSKKTFYKYFKNKEEVFNVILENLINLIENFQISKPSKTNFVSDLKAIISCYVDFFFQKEFIAMTKLMTCEIIKGRDFNIKEQKSYFKMQEQFTSWLKSYQKSLYINSFNQNEIATQFYQFIKNETYYPLLYGLKENNSGNKKEAKKYLLKIFKSLYMK